MTPQASAAIERLATLPAAMRALPQWLVWKFVADAKAKKPRKVPHYVGGGRRVGEQGSEKDRRRLASFEKACMYAADHGYEGIGFAFLPGDGLIGIDIDGAIDTDTGEVAPQCLEILASCASYAELSPSGRGVHIIVLGDTESNKSNDIGLEVFCGSQFFTCTGQQWAGTPADCTPIAPEVLGKLHEVINAAKAAAAARPAAAAPSRDESQPLELDDFKRVNTMALALLDAWVPSLFPDATRSAQGWRVTSKALGRDREEDLSLTTSGIQDFGDEQGRTYGTAGLTAIDTVLKWRGGAPVDAMRWLADQLGLRVGRPKGGKPKLRLVKPDATAAPAADAEPDDSRGGEPPPPPHQGGAAPRGRKPGGHAKGGGGIVDRLLTHYALVRGTDQVWDGEMRGLMQVKNLRLLYGTAFVNIWLAHPDRRLILAEQIRFEPGKDLPEGCVNLFDKLPTEPVPCTKADVLPMLELLRHLTSLTGDTKEVRDAVYVQVLRWCALMVQRPGAKIRFAIVMHGPQGAGKNLFWDGFRSILGQYGKMVGQSELEDRFNGYMSGKLLLIGNEVVTRQELFHNKNKLKWVITEDEIPIRGMHQEVRWESNHANVVFLSNETQPLALEKDDRRHLVVYTPAAEAGDLYIRVAAFLRDGGAAKFMHYLLQVPLGDFNEFTKPLMTEAKETLIELGLKPAERFTNEWLDGFLDLPVHVCSNGQLYRCFRRWCDINGERFPPPQPQFTTTVRRHVFERVERDEQGARLPERVHYRIVNVDSATGPRRTMRVWVPRGTGPQGEVTEGTWAAHSIEAFEAAVSRFGRTARDDDQ